MTSRERMLGSHRVPGGGLHPLLVHALLQPVRPLGQRRGVRGEAGGDGAGCLRARRAARPRAAQVRGLAPGVTWREWVEREGGRRDRVLPADRHPRGAAHQPGAAARRLAPGRIPPDEGLARAARRGNPGQAGAGPGEAAVRVRPVPRRGHPRAAGRGPRGRPAGREARPAAGGRLEGQRPARPAGRPGGDGLRRDGLAVGLRDDHGPVPHPPRPRPEYADIIHEWNLRQIEIYLERDRGRPDRAPRPGTRPRSSGPRRPTARSSRRP